MLIRMKTNKRHFVKLFSIPQFGAALQNHLQNSLAIFISWTWQKQQIRQVNVWKNEKNNYCTAAHAQKAVHFQNKHERGLSLFDIYVHFSCHEKKWKYDNQVCVSVLSSTCIGQRKTTSGNIWHTILFGKIDF